MLLDEFRDALAALPPYAIVEVQDPDVGLTRAAIETVDYHDGRVRISIDTEFHDQGEADDPEHDIDTAPVQLSRLQHIGKLVGLGCWEGYPLCCVLFFTFIWLPVQDLAQPGRRARGWTQALARRLTTNWHRGPYAHIPCPWHRWLVSRRQAPLVRRRGMTDA